MTRRSTTVQHRTSPPRISLLVGLLWLLSGCTTVITNVSLHFDKVEVHPIQPEFQYEEATRDIPDLHNPFIFSELRSNGDVRTD